MKTNPLFSLICAASIALYVNSANAQQESNNATVTPAPAQMPEQEAPPVPVQAQPAVTITEVKIGSGTEAEQGSNIAVHYTGWLYDANAQNLHGKKFDSSRDRAKPINFILGAHRVIPGWEQGLAGMKVGGKRTLVIPSELAYGERGAGGIIPPNAVLVFDVELVSVNGKP